MRTIVNAMLLTLIVTIVSIAMLLYAKAAYDTYQLTKTNWELQNTCVAHWVSMGVERSDIYRDGETCRIDRSFQ